MSPKHSANRAICLKISEIEWVNSRPWNSISATGNNVWSSIRNRKYVIPRMKLSSWHVLILMCRYNVTTSHSPAREVIESKLQVFPVVVVVRCTLIPTSNRCTWIALVARRVDYAGAPAKSTWREPTIPEVHSSLGSWLALRSGQQERAQEEGEDQDTNDSVDQKYSNLVIFLVWMQTFTFVYGKR